jgi:translation initiation factor 2B subunit (eIF-2B alpha/beta/delta family)
MTPADLEKALRDKADRWELQNLKTLVERLESELREAKKTAQSAEQKAISLSQALRDMVEIDLEAPTMQDPQGFMIDRLLSLRERIG